jgi:hypothetical protein
MHRQTKHRLVVVTHKVLEGRAIAALRLPDQNRVVDTA